jgi:hypothetical protein
MANGATRVSRTGLENLIAAGAFLGRRGGFMRRVIVRTLFTLFLVPAVAVVAATDQEQPKEDHHAPIDPRRIYDSMSRM